LFVRLLLAFASVHQTTCYQYSQGQLKNGLQIVLQPTLYLVKQAWTSLKGQPGFVGAVVSTMAVTLGALLCVLTLAYLLLIEPLPYPEQDTLFTVEHQLIDMDAKVDGNAFTYPNLMHLYTKQNVFSASALIYHDADVLLSSPSHPRLSLSFITPQWFSLLGADMAIGRSFEATEALDTYHPVAVLSYQTWEKQFALDKDILSKKMQFGEVSYRIVGVLSEAFIEPHIAGIGVKSQVFLPWDYNPIPPSQRKRWGNDDSGLMFLGKLKGSQTPDQIQQTLKALVNHNWQQEVAGHPFFKGWSIGINLHSLQSVILSKSEKTVYLLIAGVMSLLLIACTNIANLFISRTAEQHRNMAIYAALGATRKQLFKTLLAETGLLMGVSTFIAIYIASLGLTGVKLLLNNYLPRVNELSVNPFTLLCAITLMISLALFFAYLSLSMINYRGLNQSIQSSGKGGGIQVSKRIRQSLVLCQIAVVTALVFINIVLFKEAVSTINEPSGFETDDISFLVLSLPPTKDDDNGALVASMLQVRRQLSALPEVSGMSQSMAPMPFFSTALSRLDSDERYSIKAKDVDHHYFQLIQQPLLEGQYFTAADIVDDNNVMIINDVFAKQLTPQGSALGLKFNQGVSIVGVVKGIKVPGDKDIPPRFYYPASPSRNMFLVKTIPGQTLTREKIVDVLQQVSSGFKLFSLSTLNARRNSRLFRQSTTAITSGVLGIITFLLAGIGLYGILSYTTQMRKFEIGTRLAIGAKRKDVVKLIVKDNASMIVLGMLTSVLVLLALYLGFNDSLNTYLSVNLALSFIFTLLSISLLSLFACYWPLRKYINHPAIHSLRGSD
jgi:predicted permease